MQRTLHGILLALALGAIVLVPAPPAQAATYGPGFDVGLGRIGAYVTPLGTQAYCLEISKNRPLGATDAGTVDGWAGLGADSLARLNWVLHEYGQSADPVVTAAVNLYVWSVADPGTYDSHGMSGDQYYSGRAGGARDAVLAALGDIRAAAGGVPSAGTLAVELEADLSGRVVVDDPSARGGTLTIEGADVAGPIPVTDGSVVELTAAPLAGARTATVSAVATFAARTYPAVITVHDSGPDQHLAGPAGDSATATARAEVPLEFHPVLQSAVADAVIASGERDAIDRLIGSAAPESPAPWRKGATVVARGVLYGPFPAAPPESAAPPPGAPVAWTERVELPSPGEITSGGGFRPTAPGHYTWVWSIAATDQPPNSLVPVGYAWSDRFGLAAETFEVVQPLPSTGAADEPTWWLGALGALLLGAGMAGIATCARIRLRRAALTG